MKINFPFSRFAYACYMAVCNISLTFLTSLLTGSTLGFLLYTSLGLATFSVYQLYWLVCDFRSYNTSLYSFFKINVTSIAGISFSLVYCLFIFFQFQIVNLVFLLLITLIIVYFFLQSVKMYPRYNLFKGILKTILLATIWTVATTLLIIPTFKHSVYMKSVFVLHRFIFMLLLSLLFDLKDKKSDLMLGRKTAATVLSQRQINGSLLILTLLIFIITPVILPEKTGSILWVRSPLLLVPFLCFLTPLFSLKLNRYYFWAVDGMMIYISFVFYIRLM